MCDLVWLEGSPATRVLQYYSWLLSGKGRRMRLVWGRAYASLEEWSNREPRHLLLFRRACQSASSLVFYRLLVLVFRAPWLWAALVDFRRTDADRGQVASQLWGLRRSPELREEWFTYVIFDMFPPESTATEEELLQSIWLWAWEVLTTCCQMDFAHGRNRRRCHPDQLWRNFVAQSYNQESKLRHKWQEKASFKYCHLLVSHTNVLLQY